MNEGGPDSSAETRNPPSSIVTTNQNSMKRPRDEASTTTATSLTSNNASKSVRTEAIPASSLISDNASKSARTEEIPWDAEEEETLIIVALEELESAQIEEKGCKMGLFDSSNNGKSVSDVTNGSSSDEDWDMIDWDIVAQSLVHRTPVECLKKYLKLRKK